MNCSTTEAHYLGIWEVFGAKSRLMADTWVQTIESFMAPKIATAYEQHTPLHWKALQKVHAHVHQQLRHDLLSQPRVDMGGPFFTVAVKEAGSVGDWEGGEFCIPQLGIKIPM
ncbi:uncharacterized protein EDB91DRAFT_1078311 [Suillus paluster]|uniref:uncharacterized protein n=1 Tax=Suillus paluster TaxID=48578 RepID=UPI001B86B10B|nr:uncharacterized protein EDB91DRAFT_1078311 [Suillus paluster]KAG1751550.1 hypothetical protein EDB91DRAFT_1078311 [Suillus paluster]